MYSAALAAGGAAFAFHLFVDWDWDIPGVMLPALVFLGVLARCAVRGGPAAAAAARSAAARSPWEGRA